MSPEDTLEPPAFRSSDNSAAQGDADLDEQVDAAQQESRDARVGRSTRDAGSTQVSPPLDTETTNPRDEEPVDETGETAMEPGPSVPAGEPEAATPDAGVVEAPAADAGASAVDGSFAETPPDASRPPGSCTQATDCTQQCVPVGILHCCRSDGKCGCTWAPGAYCL